MIYARLKDLALAHHDLFSKLIFLSKFMIHHGLVSKLINYNSNNWHMNTYVDHSMNRYLIQRMIYLCAIQLGLTDSFFSTPDLLLASLGWSGGSGLSPHSHHRLVNLFLHLFRTLWGKTQGPQNQKSDVW